MDNYDFSGTEAEQEANSSSAILSALKASEKCFNDWHVTCQDIDSIYSLDGSGQGYGGLRAAVDGYSWQDSKLDLFWASFEVLKPAVYAKPPRPAIAPMFSDNSPVENKTSELLERCAISTFVRSDIDDVMMHARDDLLFSGRGVIWVRYDTDNGQSVEYIHLDRSDFLHEPARKWSEVGWVAGGFWLTRKEMKDRFKGLTDSQLDAATYTKSNDGEVQKCRAWEVWHKADKKVYWVAEGIDTILDETAPQLKLSGFFPCPRPAYATLKRRSLVPVPDWERYAVHFSKISELTGRIYLLLDKVRMKGLIPAGGDVGDALEQLIASDDDQLLIPVAGASMLDSGMSGYVQWMPLAELAQAITGLIEARGQLISDFYELSGISDIMRGATEAQETLGAQQLKSHYGSVRVREKIDEMQRLARDVTRIAAEIIAEHFSKDNIMEMAQTQLPSKADIEKRIKEIEDAAEGELKALADQAEQAAGQMQGEDVDPQEAEQGFKAAQQEILAKYGNMLGEAQSQVTIDEVMKLLRDDKARSFAFEIETDSTILTDDMQEKESRNEFLATFMQASQGLMQFAAMGEQGAELSGQLIKFIMAPYRAGRQLDGAIEAFVEAAPEMAAAASGGGDDGLAEANKTLAEAEMLKANAAMASVQSKSELAQAENQRKMMEIEQKAQSDAAKAQSDQDKLRLQLDKQDQEFAAKMAELDAKQNLMQAQTAEILSKIGLDVRKQDLEEYKAAENSQQREVDNIAALAGGMQEEVI